MHNLESELVELAALVQSARPAEAQTRLAGIIQAADDETLRTERARFEEVISTFLPKRRKQLDGLLQSRLLEAHALDARSARWLKDFATELRGTFLDLSDKHIFQWNTAYSTAVGQVFQKCIDSKNAEAAGPKLYSILREEFSRHASEIFGKGFHRLRSTFPVSSPVPLSKSLKGLRSFIDLPIGQYTVTRPRLQDLQQAIQLRRIASNIIAGILQGYGATRFDDTQGWKVLLDSFRSWAHYLAFLQFRHLDWITTQLESSELRSGVVRSVLPILHAIDHVLAAQDRSSFFLPSLSQFEWDLRRLEITLHIPRAEEKRGAFLEVHCYLDQALVTRTALLEALNRGVALIAAPLRPDLQERVEQDDPLWAVTVNSARSDYSSIESLSNQASEILSAQLARLLGATIPATPLKHNYARHFPLEKPREALSRQFHVYRPSIRSLVRSFETRSGVRLWCSVRRSGKTTSCFELDSAASYATVLSQTCAFTDLSPGAHGFYDQVIDVLDNEVSLPKGFFEDAVANCADVDLDKGAKLIFVLDEYETLFERMRLAMQAKPELRYKVVQPLLDQMVAFSDRNLIVFMGQQPDAHSILPEQNQLSPCIRQDEFPLFEYQSGEEHSEFAQLVKKIMTERFEYTTGFLDDVFVETGGHPYLLGNLLRDFYDWLIQIGRLTNEPTLTGADFNQFRRRRLTTDYLGVCPDYLVFRRWIRGATDDEGVRANPWLAGVYSVMREIALHHGATLACSRSDFREHVRSIRRIVGRFEADHLLETAVGANFLSIVDGNVRARVPLMARLSLAARSSNLE